MNAPSVLRAKALVAVALLMAISVACSSASVTPTPEPTLTPDPTATPQPTDTPLPTPTPDFARLEAELEDFLAQQICVSDEVVYEVDSVPEPLIMARVNKVFLPRDSGFPGAGHALRAWECHPDRLVDIETTQFSIAYGLAQGDPCMSATSVSFFSLDSLTAIEASATVCGRSTANSECSQWLLKRADSQWKAESKTQVQWLSIGFVCP